MKNKNEQKLFFIKYRGNWADEMDVFGCRIMKESDKDTYFNLFKDYFKTNELYEFGVGTNETVEYTTYADFKHHFEITEISKEDAKMLMTLGLDGFGHFPYEPDCSE